MPYSNDPEDYALNSTKELPQFVTQPQNVASDSEPHQFRQTERCDLCDGVMDAQQHLDWEQQQPRQQAKLVGNCLESDKVAMGLVAELRKVNSSFAYLILMLGDESVRIIVTPQEVRELEVMGLTIGKGESGW